MKTIYKIMIAMIAICFIATATASADTSLENVASAFSIEGGTNNQINWHSFNIASGESAQFDFGYLHSGAKSNIDTLTMPTDSTSIKAWHYQEIEIE